MLIEPEDTAEALNTVAMREFTNKFKNEFEEFIKTDLASLPS